MESITSHEAEGHGGMDVNGLCSPGGIWFAVGLLLAFNQG